MCSTLLLPGALQGVATALPLPSVPRRDIRNARSTGIAAGYKVSGAVGSINQLDIVVNSPSFRGRGAAQEHLVQTGKGTSSRQHPTKQRKRETYLREFGAHFRCGVTGGIRKGRVISLECAGVAWALRRES